MYHDLPDFCISLSTKVNFLERILAPAILKGELFDLKSEAKQLLDGSVNRKDIHAQILTTINLEMADPDPVETRKSIDMLRKKVRYVINTNFQGTNIELNEALEEPTQYNLRSL